MDPKDELAIKQMAANIYACQTLLEALLGLQFKAHSDGVERLDAFSRSILQGVQQSNLPGRSPEAANESVDLMVTALEQSLGRIRNNMT